MVEGGSGMINPPFIEIDLSSKIVSNIVENDIKHLMTPKREHLGNRVPTKIYLNKERIKSLHRDLA